MAVNLVQLPSILQYSKIKIKFSLIILKNNYQILLQDTEFSQELPESNFSL